MPVSAFMFMTSAMPMSTFMPTTAAMPISVINMYLGAPAAMTTIITMPVVAVSYIAAVADDHLVPAAPVICITGPESCMVHPWSALIYYYFIPMIYIIVAVRAG